MDKLEGDLETEKRFTKIVEGKEDADDSKSCGAEGAYQQSQHDGDGTSTLNVGKKKKDQEFKSVLMKDEEKKRLHMTLYFKDPPIVTGEEGSAKRHVQVLQNDAGSLRLKKVNKIARRGADGADGDGDDDSNEESEGQFGPWDGVMVSCLLNIFGVIMFLRLGWVSRTGRYHFRYCHHSHVWCCHDRDNHVHGCNMYEWRGQSGWCVLLDISCHWTRFWGCDRYSVHTWTVCRLCDVCDWFLRNVDRRESTQCTGLGELHFDI